MAKNKPADQPAAPPPAASATGPDSPAPNPPAGATPPPAESKPTAPDPIAVRLNQDRIVNHVPLSIGTLLAILRPLKLVPKRICEMVRNDFAAIAPPDEKQPEILAVTMTRDHAGEAIAGDVLATLELTDPGALLGVNFLVDAVLGGTKAGVVKLEPHRPKPPPAARPPLAAEREGRAIDQKTEGSGQDSGDSQD